MCLGIPGKIIDLFEQYGAKMGRVDFGGVIKEICLEYVPEAVIGQYVIVHVGFAITLLDEDSAQETLDLLRQTGVWDEEFGTLESHEEDAR
jgi:hydrogenase expression/formation protein HypC